MRPQSRRSPVDTLGEARNRIGFSWLHPRMSQTPANGRDLVSDLNATSSADRAARRTFGPGLAAAFAADNFSDSEAEAGLVDFDDFTAIAVALPRPNADRVSHRSSGRAGAGPPQRRRQFVVSPSLGRFERRPPAALAGVDVRA